MSETARICDPKGECLRRILKMYSGTGGSSESNRHRLFVLDGAHSPVSMEALCRTLRENFRYDHLIFVVSLMRDKNLREVGNIVSKTADTVIATQVSDNPRVMPAETIRNAWTGTCRKLRVCPEPEKAIAAALSERITDRFNLYHRFALSRRSGTEAVLGS